jgi:hypothetical protein
LAELQLQPISFSILPGAMSLLAYKMPFIAWSHWACTTSAWQNFFRGEDADPFVIF